MRVVVVGATGNIGSSLVRALLDEPAVESIVGVARRLPASSTPGVEYVAADVVDDPLVPVFRGADAIVHLAWAIQPSHDLTCLSRINVEGSRRVFAAAGEAGVPALVYGSSVGAYSCGPKSRAVDESWPVDGIPTSFYGRHKARTEHLLSTFEREMPSTRVVRVRPGLVFKGGAASEIRRLFLGPLVPTPLLRKRLLRAIPSIPGLRFQAVHADDLAQAYAQTIVRDVRGAFNVAADPVLDPETLARHFEALRIPVPGRLARAVTSASWLLHLQPTPPGWVDLALGVPIMDCTRAREELDWRPRRTSLDALDELVDGLAEGRGEPLPPLEPDRPGRVGEVATGVGARR